MSRIIFRQFPTISDEKRQPSKKAGKVLGRWGCKQDGFSAAPSAEIHPGSISPLLGRSLGLQCRVERAEKPATWV